MNSNDEILKDLIPTKGHVLVLGKDTSYKSKNGVLTNLKQGGSVVAGEVIRIGDEVPKEILNAQCLILKYECTEIVSDIYLVNFAGNALKMYSKTKQ